MKKILHVITKTDDELAQAVIAADRESGAAVEVIRAGPADAVDYERLLNAIFAADSVQSW
jgi:hypothetical protein